MNFSKIFSGFLFLLLAIFSLNVTALDRSHFEPLKVAHPRILIFSPHPDDDVLAASAVMKGVEAIQANDPLADLKVVYMTMGDSYGMALKLEKEKGRSKTFLDLGEERHKEALNALHYVGVKPEQSIFLAYPDQSLMYLFSLPPHSKKLYSSPATLTSKVGYSFAAHVGTPFLRDSVVNDIKRIIHDFKPTAIFTPTLTDGHPDHRATEQFVTEVLTQTKSAVPHYEFLVHWELIEDGWPQTSNDWQPPQSHIPPDISLKLTDVDWSPEEKKKVISFHDSQIAVDGPYLLGYGKNTEVFWRSRPTIGDYLHK